MTQVWMFKNGTGVGELFNADAVPKSGYSDNPKTAKKPSRPATPRRARSEGKFVADDPTTPDINEAYEK
jgi:hypothetical protein